MEKPRIGRFDMTAVRNAPRGYDESVATSAQSILLSLEKALEEYENGSLMEIPTDPFCNKFVGNLNVLVNSETGNGELRAAIRNLPSAISALSKLVNHLNAAGMGAFLVAPIGGWKQLVQWMQLNDMRFDRNRAESALSRWAPAQLNGTSDEQRALAAILIRELLIPIFRHIG
jgi:hypothetical protein